VLDVLSNNTQYQLTTSSGVLEKLIITHMVKKFPTFIECASSLPCSQELLTAPYCEPHASSPHSPTLIPQGPV